MPNNRILVVEDNETMRLGIVETLKREGYGISAFDNGIAAINHFKAEPALLAVLDLKMEPIDGIKVLEELKKISPAVEVIMMSAYGSVETAVRAMQLGAFDFLTKPFSPDELRLRVNKAFEKISNEKKIEDLIEHNRLLSEELSGGYEEIIGTSAAIRNVISLIEQVAGKDSAVLIHGESGTGKELIARAIHRKSGRSEFPFIKINCGALNDNLLESELFGHEKGAFTGAVKTKRGRFELADKGTLFLDEIGDVSPAMQVKLLRVLQEGEFERVGGEQTLSTDVRIVCATNKDLQKLIMEGKFRDDLYYRLSVIPLTVPPLRSRKEDIAALTKYFLEKTALKNKHVPKSLSESGIRMLTDYSWPGNIRELENLIERLSVISQGNDIDDALIASHISGAPAAASDASGLALDDALYNFEKNMIIDAMKKAGGVKNKAAKILGINTSALYYKLEKFGLL